MKLSGKKIAILATDGFEQSELFKPHEALKDAGADVHIISTDTGEIKAWDEGDWGKTIAVDQTIGETNAGDYDALVLPGGVINPDKLRTDNEALDFIRAFDENSKPIAAICHAPQLLISAKLVDGRKLTSYESIEVDLKNAGANWVDESVVLDSNLITSRNPNDLPDFNEKIIETLSQTANRPAGQR